MQLMQMNSLIMQLMQMRSNWYIRVELSTISLIMQLVQMKGGTQGAIFMCYITMEPKLYNPVSWDFAIVQNEGNFIQYSGYSYNC